MDREVGEISVCEDARVSQLDVRLELPVDCIDHRRSVQ